MGSVDMFRIQDIKKSHRAIAAAAMFAAAALAAGAAEVKVDFSREVGPVKCVNGVGQPPLVGKLGDWSMMHYLKDAGIPYSRLHDVGGWLGGGMFVDIPNLFPDSEADENDPANYRFAYTDSLVKALDKNGVEPFFRLGVSIENFAERGFPPVNILPPKDFAKWARVCEHVIRHYTEGWADGFKMKITYWEIWNEPENHPDPKKNPMWRGDWESYMRFYGTVAPYLKKKFPHLKIGGYGHCGFYAGVGSDHVPAANSSPRMEYFVDCSHKFLAAARDNKWPLDFFSFHSYSNPSEAMRQVRFADEHLGEYGFTADKCERIFNEWLPYVGHANIGSAMQAAGVAAELIGLQNGPCDVACIYDARCGTGSYAPLFNPLAYKPHKAYYAFTAFNELRRRGTAVAAEVSGDKDLWVAAARGENDAAVMMANDSDRSIPLVCDFQGRAVSVCRITDENRTDEPVALPAELPPRSFVLAIVGLQGESPDVDDGTISTGATTGGVLVLSFDDRNLADWERAIPLFDKYGAHATFFFTGSCEWDAARVLKKLREHGHSIGLHGFKHQNADVAVAAKGAAAYWAEEIAPQLAGCRAAGIPITSYAYPNCRRTDETDELFRTNGFKHVRGGLKGVTPYDPQSEKQEGLKPVHTVDRAFFPASELPSRFRLDTAIAGEAYHTDIEDILKCIRRCAERNEAFVLTSHGIHSDAKHIHMKTEWLERILATAKECGVAVLGFDEL